jgi:2'-5' RNA ligase
MYLISAYFDENTNRVLQGYIEKVAKVTGNDFMVANHVPPHLTLSAIEARSVDVLVPAFEKLDSKISRGDISLITVGQLMPKVLYVSPYLNEYLQNLEQQVFDCFKDIPNTTISSCYRPFSWLPHITLAKTLTREQMLAAVQTMVDFKRLDASIVGLGLAKVNPHQDVRLIDLH